MVCSLQMKVGLRFLEEKAFSNASFYSYSHQSLSRSRDVNQREEVKIILVSLQCFPGLPLPCLTSCNTDTRSYGWRNREPGLECSMP